MQTLRTRHASGFAPIGVDTSKPIHAKVFYWGGMPLPPHMTCLGTVTVNGQIGALLYHPKTGYWRGNAGSLTSIPRNQIKM